MSVTIINNHVLLPHRANWTTDPEWTRTWQTDVATAVTGPEARSALRAHARIGLQYKISPKDLEERAQLEARVIAALKSGFCAIPYFGRASNLALDVTANLVTLTELTWPWAVDDWLLLMDEHREWDCRQIIAIDGLELTLDDNVARTYADGLPFWPLLYGKIGEESMQAITSHHGDIPINFSEHVSPASTQVGDYTPPVGGDEAIPDMEIGTTFEVR